MPVPEPCTDFLKIRYRRLVKRCGAIPIYSNTDLRKSTVCKRKETDFSMHPTTILTDTAEIRYGRLQLLDISDLPPH
jgi:hypothetical protein